MVSAQTDSRDFPRLPVEAKVRIAGTATSAVSQDQPAVISDLSLGGARLATPVTIEVGRIINLIPFLKLREDHPLNGTLSFEVIWSRENSCEPGSEQSAWHEYGLLHQGSVLDILHSWLGHLLLRNKGDNQEPSKPHSKRIKLVENIDRPLRARASHDSQTFNLSLLDMASSGLLARSETDQIPVGVHLELESAWDTPDPADLGALMGCVVDAHSHSGSTFYRVAFDPDSELDESGLVDWAESLGGTLEP